MNIRKNQEQIRRCKNDNLSDKSRILLWASSRNSSNCCAPQPMLWMTVFVWYSIESAENLGHKSLFWSAEMWFMKTAECWHDRTHNVVSKWQQMCGKDAPFLRNNDNDSQSNGKGRVSESYWMPLKLDLEINGEKDTQNGLDTVGSGFVVNVMYVMWQVWSNITSIKCKDIQLKACFCLHSSFPSQRVYLCMNNSVGNTGTEIVLKWCVSNIKYYNNKEEYRLLTTALLKHF